MTESQNYDIMAPTIVTGHEDKFYYEIADTCVMCGACASGCPVQAIEPGDNQYRVNTSSCIDCGTCSVLCPTGAAHRTPFIRESMSLNEIDMRKCYFNPGCTLSLYKPDVPVKMLKLLQDHLGNVKFHNICCRHDPDLEPGSTIINNCEIEEAQFSGMESVCCGDNFYGAVSKEQVEERIKMRAEQFPCDNVVVYCIGCVRAMTSGGKIPRYLPDLLLDRASEPMLDTLDEYHSRLAEYIQKH